MKLNTKLFLKVFRFHQRLRYNFVKRWLLTEGKGLDVGCGDGGFVKIMKERGLDTIGVDKKYDGVDVENMPFPDNSFDVVVAFEVIEHTLNPVKAIEELKRVCRNQLIISIPNEPWFSFVRLSWEKQHYWAIRPELLQHYLGKPKRTAVFLIRWWFGEWIMER